MIRRSMLACPLAFASIGASAVAQPVSPPGKAYKVAFWYDLDRPFSSVKYRAYDLAKGEYDPSAVERWRRTIREHHPNTGATVRDLSTVGEPGATEAERLASAVEREERRWVDLSLRASPRPPLRLSGPSPGFRPKDVEGGAPFDRPAPGAPGGPGNPPTSPIPYPYRTGPR